MQSLPLIFATVAWSICPAPDTGHRVYTLKLRFHPTKRGSVGCLYDKRTRSCPRDFNTLMPSAEVTREGSGIRATLLQVSRHGCSASPDFRRFGGRLSFCDLSSGNKLWKKVPDVIKTAHRPSRNTTLAYNV